MFPTLSSTNIGTGAPSEVRIGAAAQRWRLHLLAVLTPSHSFIQLVALLPEQRGWREFALLAHRHCGPGVRMLNEFRSRVGVGGLRAINDSLRLPLIERAAGWSHTVALIDATDLPAACCGFKKKKPSVTPRTVPPWAAAPSRPAKAAVLWATRSIPSGCGGVSTPPPCCWYRWSVGWLRPMFRRAVSWCPACVTVSGAGRGGRRLSSPIWAIWPPRLKPSAGNVGAWRSSPS